MAATLHEAYDCASHALAYLFNASTHLRVDDVESVTGRRHRARILIHPPQAGKEG